TAVFPAASPDATTVVGKRTRAANLSRFVATLAALSFVLALAFGLRFYRLGADSIGNEYYAATVQSMLTSWHNFFFAAFEPGGSVSVDKPPLGFWVQAASAAVFGVNGFALALPQALAGVFSVALLFHLARRRFGALAGLLAALFLAVVPVAVATERNNTIDGQLVLVLLLATWAFLKATERGQGRYVLIGSLLVGLGFNIKMLQAFLPLPAFYAAYLLAGGTQLWRKLLHLTLATLVLLAVSLSWAVVVDLTPPDARPYVGSSTNNTVMELILGHNGLSRLLPGGLRRLADAPGAPSAPGPPPQPPAFGPADGPPPGAPVPGQPPAGGQPGFPPPPGRVGVGGGSSFNWEIGEPGLTRLLEQPLVDQASWLLPLAGFGLALGFVPTRMRWPLAAEHGELVLWGGWLAVSAGFFTVASLFHAYYLIMLGPPVAALAGVGVAKLWRASRTRPIAGPLALAGAFGITGAFALWVLRDYPEQAAWLAPTVVLLLIAGVGGLLLGKTVRRFAHRGAGDAMALSGLGLCVAAVVAAPLTWSAITAAGVYENMSLPSAGPPTADEVAGDGQVGGPPRNHPDSRDDLIAYLTPRTTDTEYLVATLSARDAAPLILATGRPVLTFGGFSGGDPIFTAADVAAMVETGALRYVYVSLTEMQRRHGDIAQWIGANCVAEQWRGAGQSTPAPQFPAPLRDGGAPAAGGPGGGLAQLFVCG
ncbi:MAG: glycosyltransferase family 39 protein, partial [Anaerolineales bacterium]